MTLADGDYETVAGYVIARLGRMPKVGDVVLVDGARIVVDQMEGWRITQVSVTKAPEPEA